MENLSAFHITLDLGWLRSELWVTELCFEAVVLARGWENRRWWRGCDCQSYTRSTARCLLRYLKSLSLCLYERWSLKVMLQCSIVVTTGGAESNASRQEKYIIQYRHKEPNRGSTGEAERKSSSQTELSTSGFHHQSTSAYAFSNADGDLGHFSLWCFAQKASFSNCKFKKKNTLRCRLYMTRKIGIFWKCISLQQYRNSFGGRPLRYYSHHWGTIHGIL